MEPITAAEVIESLSIEVCRQSAALERLAAVLFELERLAAATQQAGEGVADV